MCLIWIQIKLTSFDGGPVGDTLVHSSKDSASAIASKAWHSLLSSPLSQQFTVLDTPSGSTTVTLVTRGELLGANEGEIVGAGCVSMLHNIQGEKGEPHETQTVIIQVQYT